MKVNHQILKDLDVYYLSSTSFFMFYLELCISRLICTAHLVKLRWWCRWFWPCVLWTRQRCIWFSFWVVAWLLLPSLGIHAKIRHNNMCLSRAQGRPLFTSLLDLRQKSLIVMFGLPKPSVLTDEVRERIDWSWRKEKYLLLSPETIKLWLF